MYIDICSIERAFIDLIVEVVLTEGAYISIASNKGVFCIGHYTHFMLYISVLPY